MLCFFNYIKDCFTHFCDFRWSFLQENSYLWLLIFLLQIELWLFSCILIVYIIEKVVNLIWFNLIRKEHSVSDKHLPKEISDFLCWVSLQYDVQVSEASVSIPNTRVHVCYIERPTEDVIINKHNFLMVSLENRRDPELEQMPIELSEGVIPDNNTACRL